MLPFMKSHKEASVSAPVDSVKRKPDTETDDEFSLDSEAMREFLSAMEAKDLKAMCDAMDAYLEIRNSKGEEHNG